MNKVHFIAIGGSAMHNLAIALHLKGVKVTGSDDTIFEPSKSRLAAYDLLPPQDGWNADKVTNDIDAVILGMHAHADNPELAKAKELGIPIFSYPEFLYEQAKEKTRVVIGGSHGKTTITSMVLHALHYHKKEVDYMVGAQLEGFDVMVKLTQENDFMLLEGDEYLSSPIDKRPKFLLYQPNIALISGIAWDHVNVFPTFESYIDQFKLFIDSISEGGVIVYNEEDIEVKKLVESHPKPLKKIPYTTPAHFIQDETTFIETGLGSIPLKIFGNHNLNNLEGARLICNQMGLMDDDFYEAISHFTGASKRLELIKEANNSKIYKDFAHAPSKVRSTSQAIKDQYADKTVVACLELHTYSSLRTDFLYQYKDTMNSVDHAVVFYSPEAIALKRLPPIEQSDIIKSFGREDLKVFTDRKQLEEYLKNQNKADKIFLMMSSGNWDGLKLEEII